jgi:hypothetical protein
MMHGKKSASKMGCLKQAARDGIVGKKSYGCWRCYDDGWADGKAYMMLRMAVKQNDAKWWMPMA